jgi:hypothetical protein
MDVNVQKKFETYPSSAQAYFLELRAAIYDVAKTEALGVVEESLKWGEPSYWVKGGSALRLDWKLKSPQQLSLLVNCKTSLVETYKEVFGDIFQYEGRREIVLPLAKSLPVTELKVCISLSLRYHKIKKLVLLGL